MLSANIEYVCTVRTPHLTLHIPRRVCLSLNRCVHVNSKFFYSFLYFSRWVQGNENTLENAPLTLSLESCLTGSPGM